MANPEALGRYRFKRLLGRGALGEVWEAVDLEERGAKVAVKIMRAADAEMAFARETFARDVELARLVDHPHMAAVYDAGEAAGTSFMVMHMVEGPSLRRVLRDGPMTSADRVRWIREIGEALAAMHRVGLAHRDLKPENVIIRADRSACLVDFGIAKWVRIDMGADPDDVGGHGAPEAFVGPPAYVPPEAAEYGVYDELGDQYAWAVIAHEVLTGVVPAAGALAAAGQELPESVEEALARARSKARSERWRAMDPLLEHVSRALDARAVEAPDAAAAEVAPRSAEIVVNAAGGPAPRRRARIVVGVFALALLALTAAVLAALR